MGDRVEGVCKKDVMASCTVGGDVDIASVPAMKDKEMKARDDVRVESEKSDAISQQQEQPGN